MNDESRTTVHNRRVIINTTARPPNESKSQEVLTCPEQFLGDFRPLEHVSKSDLAHKSRHDALPVGLYLILMNSESNFLVWPIVYTSQISGDVLGLGRNRWLVAYC